MGRRLGLVVGVNQYQDNTFQPLQFAENDARALAQWLVNARGGKWAPTDVQLVHGRYATRDLIESLVMQLCVSVAEPDDLVLVYLAGHAFIDERSGDGYLALVDTSYGEPSTGLHLLFLAQQAMTRSRAARILFVLDSFQTGQMWSMRRTSPYDVKPLLGPMLIQGLQQRDNRVLLCSCRGNERAPEAGERGLGLFMYRTIVGLSGQVSTSGAGNVTLQQLYTYLSSTLEEQQRPQVFGQPQGQFVLIGDPNSVQQQAAPVPQSPSPVGPQQSNSYPSQAPYNVTGSPTLSQAAHNTTAAVQMPPSLQQETARPITDVLPNSTFEQQRQQQSKLLLNQAQQLLQMQKPNEALQITNQALQITPYNSTGLTFKAQILGTMGRFQEALTAVDQLLQHEPSNALAWSMRAVLLTNMAQHQAALAAIERSLELDANNPETYAIKTNIMTSVAIAQSRDKSLPKNDLIASDKRRNGPLSFFLGTVLQFVGLILGLAGTLLPVLQPGLPIGIAFVLEGFGLSLLCVNAARGAYRHGFLRVLVTLFVSLIAATILVVSLVYKPAYRKIVFELQAHPSLLLPLLFLGGWLALAAALPVLLAIIGFISGLVIGVRRRTT